MKTLAKRFLRKLNLLPKPALLEAPFEDPNRVKHYAESTRDDAIHGAYERAWMLKHTQALPKGPLLVAGGGPGIYGQTLAQQGHTVVSLDASVAMTAYAQSLLAPPHQAIAHALENPLPFEDHTFEAILSPLTLHYVEHWEPVFQEFYRTLAPGGRLLISVLHPLILSPTQQGYHQVQRVYQYFSDFGGQIGYYRRPLAHHFTPLLSAGFELHQVCEPLPSAELTARFADTAKALENHPLFLFLEARKPTSS